MKDMPVTAAVRFLRAHKVDFLPRPYKYEERGGTRVSARELGVDEHQVIKTLIFEDEARQPLVVLMHGDCNVSTKNLARQLGTKRVAPCDPTVAERHSGYKVGGTSPFGLRKRLPVYAERTIQTLPRLYINGGARGLLVELSPAELARVLAPVWVDAKADPSS